MNAIPLSWWNKLSENEQNLLIELLYDLDLQDYFVMDKDGNLIERLR